MLNPDAELQRLRYSLNDRGWMPSELDEIIDQASNDINEAILDIVSNAVAEATDYAIDLGAEEFVEDIDIAEIGGSFMIITRSGNTDYSIPERQMLPDLLKNAKIAEDGSRYKVIPVGSRSNSVSPHRDMFSAMQATQEAQREARSRLIQNSMDKRSARAQAVAEQFKHVITGKLAQIHQSRATRADKGVKNSGSVDFATASSKQDPTTKWVIPEKRMDMTGYIMDMNKRIEESTFEVVRFIIGSYEQEFA